MDGCEPEPLPQHFIIIRKPEKFDPTTGEWDGVYFMFGYNSKADMRTGYMFHLPMECDRCAWTEVIEK